MKSKSAKFKLLAIIDFIVGFILTLVALILYQYGNKTTELQEEPSALFVISIIALISLINSLVLYILYKKAKDKEASPVEY
jgi:heme/copper-type cytochrome/quinol oxidase subunit 4